MLLLRFKTSTPNSIQNSTKRTPFLTQLLESDVRKIPKLQIYHYCLRMYTVLSLQPGWSLLIWAQSYLGQAGGSAFALWTRADSSHCFPDSCNRLRRYLRRTPRAVPLQRYQADIWSFSSSSIYLSLTSCLIISLQTGAHLHSLSNQCWLPSVHILSFQDMQTLSPD